MGCVTVIEPVVGLHAFAMFMTYPLVEQYIYRRLWEQLSGSPFPASINQSHCTNYTNLSIHQVGFHFILSRINIQVISLCTTGQLRALFRGPADSA